MKHPAKTASFALIAAITGIAVFGCSKRAAPEPSASTTEASAASATSARLQPAPSAASSASCFACESTPATCAEFVSCDSVSGDAAEGSPAAGKSKASLCKEVLDCVHDSGCAVGAAPVACYCGNTNAADCQGGLANGKCRAQLERGLETTKPATIFQHFKNTKFGGGLAMARVDCDQTFCMSQCGFRPPPGPKR